MPSSEKLHQKIFETLSDKRNDDATVANYLQTAYSTGVTDHIYAVVQKSIGLYGPDNIKISDGVIKILAKNGITLHQDEHGFINMHKELITTLDDDKDATGSRIGRIEFSQRNEGPIFEALRYGSPTTKAQIIRQAVQQGAESFLNQLVPRFYLDGVDLGGLDLRGLNLEEAVLQGANLSKTNMEAMDLNHANLNNANVDGANLSRSVLYCTSFGAGSARGANFDRANLEELCADSTDFSGARITNANCTATRFVGATLTGADMRTTSLIDTNFTNAKLGATLVSAHTEETRFLEGFVLTTD